MLSRSFSRICLFSKSREMCLNAKKFVQGSRQYSLEILCKSSKQEARSLRLFNINRVQAAISAAHISTRMMDPSTKSLVDWNRGMVRQVGLLGPNYERWIDFPVDREIILFDSPWMERLTKTPWYTIPVIWMPVILCFLAFSSHSQGRYLGAQNISVYLSGLLMWTLLEYLIHRFIFHMTVPKDSRVLITLHFLLHGIHHKAPFDKNRLVLPPVAGIIYLIPIYLSVWAFLPLVQANAAIAGIITGYVTYDLCHYYLHYGNPDKKSFLHQLKRYHSYHHFVHHTLGYGVTSKIWDVGFGTELILDSKCNEH